MIKAKISLRMHPESICVSGRIQLRYEEDDWSLKMWVKQFSWFDMRSPLLLEGDALEEALGQK